MNYIPFVIEKDSSSYERSYDIYSRLLKDRIIFIGSSIDDQVANSVIAQLLFLECDNSEKDISIYINSPGGSVTAGLAIIDTMNIVKPLIKTICVGQAASMGAVILSCGNKNKRLILPNARVMIHQPWGNCQGKVSDIEIQTNEIKKLKKILNEMLSNNCGKSIKIIEKDTDRDYFMDSEESVKYGIVDKILFNKKG